MPRTNKHPQTTWHIEQHIKDKLKVIATTTGINTVSGMARIILVEYIKRWEAENGEIKLPE